MNRAGRRKRNEFGFQVPDKAFHLFAEAADDTLTRSIHDQKIDPRIAGVLRREAFNA